MSADAKVSPPDSSTNSNREFLCGVIEGFYGKPWNISQRHELFIRLQRFGMNTYMYAPKDDYKHRRHWRQLYTKKEADDLQNLIRVAETQKIKFVYALSPGLDMIYSNKDELRALQKKLDQVRELGCKYFALLFDDIENELSREDSKVFPSFAHAQCQVTNDMYEYLNKPDLFLFCPTEYCTSRAVPSLSKSSYLKTVGEKLNENIDFLWTGPKVVSRQISVDGIEAVSKVVKRRVTIWDNIHANDYDQTRLYLGPYSGRSTELIGRLRGVLTNPNCELETNFIALHTLAQWSKNICTRFKPTDMPSRLHSDYFDDDDMDYDEDDDDDDEGASAGYKPRRALHMAAADWLPELYRVKSLSFSDSNNQKDGSPNPVDVSDGKDDSSAAPIDRLMTSDLVFLSNFFYLPHVNGPEAQRLIKCARWLVDNSPALNRRKPTSYSSPDIGNDSLTTGAASPPPAFSIAGTSLSAGGSSLTAGVPGASSAAGPSLSATSSSTSLSAASSGTSLSAGVPGVSEREWYATARRFHDGYGDLSVVVDKLSDMPNRELVYEIYHYINDMRSNIALVNSYIKWIAVDMGDREPFKSGEQEPWVHRGGLLAEFRRLLPIDGRNDETSINSAKTSEQVFIVRPYRPSDKMKVFEVARKTCDDRMDGTDAITSCPDIAGDCLIGAFLQFYPNLCYVIEDDYGIIGYAGAAESVEDYNERVRKEWLPEVLSRYTLEDKKSNNERLSPHTLLSFLEKTIDKVTDEVLNNYSTILHLSVLPSRVTGPRAASSLLQAVTSQFRDDIKGVHTNLPVHSHAERELFLKLDFTVVNTGQEGIMSFITLAKSIE